MNACENFINRDVTTWHKKKRTLEDHILELLAEAPDLIRGDDQSTYDDQSLKLLWDVAIDSLEEMDKLLESRNAHDAMLAAELGGLVALLGSVLFRTSEGRNDQIGNLNNSVVEENRRKTESPVPFRMREVVQTQVPPHTSSAFSGALASTRGGTQFSSTTA